MIQFNIRFYVIALDFIIFDVEVVLLYPWAVVANDFGWYGFGAMSIFVVVLLLGLAYAWRKGALEWVRPKLSGRAGACAFSRCRASCCLTRSLVSGRAAGA